LIEENYNRGWRQTIYKDKGDLKWVGSSIEDSECTLSLFFIYTLVLEILKDKSKIVNRYPGIVGLAHKDAYSKIMKIA
jgi:hypothetical protein